MQIKSFFSFFVVKNCCCFQQVYNIQWRRSRDYIFWILLILHNTEHFIIAKFCQNWIVNFLAPNKVSTAILSLFSRAQNHIFSAISPRISDGRIWKAYEENRRPWLAFEYTFVSAKMSPYRRTGYVLKNMLSIDWRHCNSFLNSISRFCQRYKIKD